jgi:hypothetical protein
VDAIRGPFEEAGNMPGRHRIPKRSLIASAGVLALVVGGGTALALSSSGAQAATTTLCQFDTSPVSGGTYTVQNNEFGSSASECASTDGNADFTVANSSIDNATDGSPGAYPSIYQGCHWGNCSSGGLTSAPVQVADLTPGTVTTSWSTTQPGGSSVYDVAYDIWFNQTPTTSGQPNCAEMMVWLNHNGSVQPFGSQVASDVSLGGQTYSVWEGGQSFGDTVTYDMTTAATSVSDLDVGTLAQDAVSRGYISSSCYLIDIEAGFELWQGGAGLATNSFSVNAAGIHRTVMTPTPTPASPGTCSASYSTVSAWQGGFLGQISVTDTGSSALDGWNIGWTFPGDQEITSLWNGNDTQSGAAVTIGNASYDGSVAPGATVTVGFTATNTGDTAPGITVSCS